MTAGRKQVGVRELVPSLAAKISAGLRPQEKLLHR